MTELEHIVEHCEQHEQNVYDFEDIRFAEIYLTDKEAKGKSVALYVGRARNKTKQSF